jgi:hypothetical protein
MLTPSIFEPKWEDNGSNWYWPFKAQLGRSMVYQRIDCSRYAVYINFDGEEPHYEYDSLLELVCALYERGVLT